MSRSALAPLVIVAVSVVPAGIVVEVANDVIVWPGWVAVGGALVALIWGAALWFRRRDDKAELVPGLVAAVLVLAMAGLGIWRGSAEASIDSAGSAQSNADMDQFGGWIGQATSDGARYLAVEYGAETTIAQKINAMFERRFITLLVTVDNRGSGSQVVLDLGDARLEPANVGKDAVLPRASVLDSARGDREMARKLHGGRYVVAPGERLGGGLVFVDPARALDKITGLTVTVNGKPLLIPGRFYSSEEKRAMRGQKR